MRALLSSFVLLLPLILQAEVVVPIETVKSHVNVRMSADASSEVVGKLQQGDALPLVASDGEWHEVKIAGGATGFISADWTEVLDEKPQASAKSERPVGETNRKIETPEQETSIADTESTVDENDAGEKLVADTEAIARESGSVADAGSELIVSNDQDAERDDDSEYDEKDVTATVDESVSPAAEDDAASVADTKLAASSDVLEEIVIDVAKRGEDSSDVDERVADNAAAQKDAPAQREVARETIEPGSKDRSGADAILDSDTNDEQTADRVVASHDTDTEADDGLSTITIVRGPQGPPGAMGPPGPAGPPGSGSAGEGSAARIEGSVDFLMKFSAPTVGASSQVFDDGNNVGIGTTDPKQRLEVNGNIQIHERNSSVAGLMITQASGDTGYIMHNQASTLTIGAGSIDRITINREGNVGIGVSRPAQPMEMASGAYVSTGGVWTNSSSRSRKENIAALTPEEALTTLAQLQPVEFNYKNDQQEKYVGFIAEDVPDLVATNDRLSLSTMDIVAVLTKVVQEQQKKIAELEARLEQR